jgi:glycerol-3-phosphate acyltransferase PlsY
MTVLALDMPAGQAWHLTLAIAAWCVGAYLVGSIPFGYLLGRAKGVDIRDAGSRNIGATNCWRVCGWPYGLAAFVLDVAKGFGPTFGAYKMTELCPLFTGLSEPGRDLVIVLAGAAAIAGHVFPIYLRFRGGKAVATSLGVFLGIPAMLPFAAVAFAVWLLVFAATRYVSVASTVAALAFGALALTVEPWSVHLDPGGAWRDRWPLTAATVLLVLLVLYRHRENYARLRAGTENKFGRGKKT